MASFRPRLLPLLSLAGLSFAGWYVFTAPKVEPAPPAVQPPRAPYPTTLAASGILEPAAARVTALGTPFASLVTEVYVEVGDHVAAGARLFRLDDRLLAAQAKVLEAQVAVAQSEVAAAKAQLAAVEAQVATARASQGIAEARLLRLRAQPRAEDLPPAQAKVEEAQALVADRRDQLRRYEEAMKGGSGVASMEEFDRRRYGMSIAERVLDRAVADLALLQAGAWAPDLAEAEAAIGHAKGGVAQAEAAAARERAAVATSEASLLQAKASLALNATELERATVKSPIDATVLDVAVRAGEYAAANRETLMTIGDLSTLLVRADIDEESLPLVRTGAKAKGVVRGFPDKPFELQFVRIEPYVRPKRSLTGATNERVDTRVLQVIFKAGPAELPLYVGQQVDVFMEGVPRTMGPAVPGVMPSAPANGAK